MNRVYTGGVSKDTCLHWFYLSVIARNEVTKQSHSYQRRRRVAILSSATLRLLHFVRNDTSANPVIASAVGAWQSCLLQHWDCFNSTCSVQALRWQLLCTHVIEIPNVCFGTPLVYNILYFIQISTFRIISDFAIKMYNNKFNHLKIITWKIHCYTIFLY